MCVCVALRSLGLPDDREARKTVSETAVRIRKMSASTLKSLLGTLENVTSEPSIVSPFRRHNFIDIYRNVRVFASLYAIVCV